MKKRINLITGSALLASTLLVQTPAMAQEQDDESAPEMCECPADPVVDNSWIGNVGVGVVATGGNTENKSANANIDVTRDLEIWRHNLHVDSLFAANEQGSTAERYFASFQSDYKLGEQSYLFGYASAEKDRFSGYEWQATAVFGFGHTLLATENKNLNVEVGPGYRASRSSESFFRDDDNEKIRDPITGEFILREDNETENEVILRLAEHFDWQFSSSSRFVQELSLEAGEENTVARGLLALESQIAGSLFVRLYYTIKHNSEVPVGTEKSDTETGVTIAYNF